MDYAFLKRINCFVFFPLALILISYFLWGGLLLFSHPCYSYPTEEVGCRFFCFCWGHGQIPLCVLCLHRQVLWICSVSCAGELRCSSSWVRPIVLTPILMTCVWLKGKTTCCKKKKAKKIIRDVLTASYYSNNTVFFLFLWTTQRKITVGHFSSNPRWLIFLVVSVRGLRGPLQFPHRSQDIDAVWWISY